MSVAPGSTPGAAARYGKLSVEAAKRSFFDRDAVLRAMDRTTAKALSRFGAFTRQRWRTSLRYRVPPAPPGSPPSAHRTMSRLKTNKRTGISKRQEVSPLREFIFFAYEAATQTVVIGPAATNQKNAQGLHGQTVPEVIEHGGTETIFEHLAKAVTLADGTRLPERWLRTDLRYRLSEGPRSAANRPTRQRTAHYAARPAGQLAFDAELPGFLAGLKDSLGG